MGPGKSGPGKLGPVCGGKLGPFSVCFASVEDFGADMLYFMVFY